MAVNYKCVTVCFLEELKFLNFLMNIFKSRFCSCFAMFGSGEFVHVLSMGISNAHSRQPLDMFGNVCEKRKPIRKP